MQYSLYDFLIFLNLFIYIKVPTVTMTMTESKFVSREARSATRLSLKGQPMTRGQLLGFCMLTSSPQVVGLVTSGPNIGVH